MSEKDFEDEVSSEESKNITLDKDLEDEIIFEMETSNAYENQINAEEDDDHGNQEIVDAINSEEDGEESGSSDKRLKNNLLVFSNYQGSINNTIVPFELENIKKIEINKIRDVRHMAQFLHTKGFKPIPTKPGSKSIKKIDDNPNMLFEEYVETYFEPGDNISLQLGQINSDDESIDSQYSIIDLDLEVEEARIFAHHFLRDLPTTSYGRRSASKSHYIFKVKTNTIKTSKMLFTWPEGMRSRKKEDNGALILELRPSGNSLIPPSTHSSGEILFWMSDFDPPRISYNNLYQMAGRIAAGAVVLRCWAEGIRDNLVISLAGWLLKEGWSFKDVMDFMETIFLCAWPIDQRDIRQWRMRIKEISNKVIDAKEKGEVVDEGNSSDESSVNEKSAK